MPPASYRQRRFRGTRYEIRSWRAPPIWFWFDEFSRGKNGRRLRDPKCWFIFYRYNLRKIHPSNSLMDLYWLRLRLFSSRVHRPIRTSLKFYLTLCEHVLLLSTATYGLWKFILSDAGGREGISGNWGCNDPDGFQPLRGDPARQKKQTVSFFVCLDTCRNAKAPGVK